MSRPTLTDKTHGSRERRLVATTTGQGEGNDAPVSVAGALPPHKGARSRVRAFPVMLILALLGEFCEF